ncbi:MAG TPA: metalloregulator ArsR/SmtB family transcription factor [Candidatus Sulfotelmatobacter sp.]|nr:metalloregulator ArsR/SmtB family transcription factor [Candidatus Sulfotelmatobacter sp.]
MSLAAVARSLRKAKLAPDFAHRLAAFTDFLTPCVFSSPTVELEKEPMQLALDLSLHAADPCYILNPMVQCQRAHLDASFAALSDATRRGILERLGRTDASITDLAEKFHMTLTGMKKHVGVLEQAGLVTTEKVGRVRTCKLGLRRLQEEAAWIERYRQLWDARFEELDKIVESLKREERVDGRKKRK